MGYEHVNTKGIKYYLHSKLGGKNKMPIYFFSKDPAEGIEMPEGFIVVESPLTKLPILKKK
ncbi:MAG TPA: hypothetical protein VJG83_01935 [archaeon]|nr:hypothetical protein [archaeon]